MSNRSRKITLIISLSFFMEALDSTVINTAIPAMSKSLHVGPVDVKVALISYLLGLAIFIPISGWIADKFGSKKTFINALLVFTLSSLWCGFASHLNELIIARFIQGVGGALGLPVGRLILIRTFGRENLITTMNQVAAVGALGLMLGPVIGGFITNQFSWHWIFWVNIPVGIFSLIFASRWLEESALQSVAPLDKLGFVLFGSALGCFTYGLSALSETSVSLLVALVYLLLSVSLLMAYIVHSRTQSNLIVNVELLKLRTFRVAVIGNLITRLGFGGVPFLVPLLLQISFGFSAQLSGLLLAPTAAGVILSKPFILKLLRFLGYKRLLISNTICVALSIWLFIFIDNNTSVYTIGLFTFLYGFTVAQQYSTMNSLAYADISTNNLSAATSIMGTIQQLAQSFGVAATAIFIRIFTLFFSDNLTLSSTVFHATFFVLGLLTIISLLIFIQLKREDGEHMFL